MIRFTDTIAINRPVDDVFTFLADFRHVPLWNHAVITVDALTEVPVRVGTRFHQVRQTDEQDYDITQLERPFLIEITTTPSSRPALVARFDLHPTETGTSVTDTWNLETGLPRALERLAGRRIRAAVADNLDRLKTLLETGTAVLQDGRVTRTTA
jgi:uncharacterized membrane protein